MSLLFCAPLHHEANPGLLKVEVATSFQIPAFQIIGLPSQEVSEARERVRAAIEASGLEFPRRKVILNLSPASVRKSGTGTDLAMALAVLADAEPPPRHALVAAWAELGLDGALKPVGQLTRAVHAAWAGGAYEIWVARADLAAAEARLALLSGAGCFDWTPPRVHGADHLLEAWDRIRTPARAEIASPPRLVPPAPDRAPESGLVFPSPLERTLVAAAAGEHHLLLLGPRGSGKSQALERLESLLPDLSPRLAVERLLIEELRAPYSPLSLRRPVRRVSPQNRPASLLGQFNGTLPRPGEIPLAHGGLLVADEFPEWPRDSREALREPLEAAICRVSRTRDTLEFPARFSLAASGNLCPCGGWPRELPSVGRGGTALCVCRPGASHAYLTRISGPLLDRIDLVALVAPETPPPPPSSRASGSSLRDKVARCRETLTRLWGETPGRLAPAELERMLEGHAAWRGPLRLALGAPAAGASLRSRHKILRTALTFAVCDGRETPQPGHFLEAALGRAETWLRPRA